MKGVFKQRRSYQSPQQSPLAANAFLCLLCGGVLCPYENYTLWTSDPDHPNAIDGLFSNWITNNILATQRPSTRLIKEYSLLERFQQLGLTAVFNLQQLNEHETCGDGLDLSSGFSYIPQTFMDQNISFYNFGWVDMEVPELEFALKLVQVMAHALENGGKIAVHCHAGLGRTGLAIGCYLVYGARMEPEDAITLIRSKRPRSIQNAKQQAFIKDFQNYLVNLYTVFPSVSPIPSPSLSFETIIDNQSLFLAGEEGRILKNIPKIIYLTVLNIREYILHCSEVELDVCKDANSTNTPRVSIDEICVFISEFRTNQRSISPECRKIMLAVNSRQDYANITDMKNIYIMTYVELLLNWVVSLRKPLMSVDLVSVILETTSPELINITYRLDRPVFCTINCILDIFRCMPKDARLADDAIYNLAVLFNKERPNADIPQTKRSKQRAVVTGPRLESQVELDNVTRKDTTCVHVARFLKMVIELCKVKEDGAKPQMLNLDSIGK